MLKISLFSLFFSFSFLTHGQDSGAQQGQNPQAAATPEPAFEVSQPKSNSVSLENSIWQTKEREKVQALEKAKKDCSDQILKIENTHKEKEKKLKEVEAQLEVQSDEIQRLRSEIDLLQRGNKKKAEDANAITVSNAPAGGAPSGPSAAGAPGAASAPQPTPTPGHSNSVAPSPGQVEPSMVPTASPTAPAEKKAPVSAEEKYENEKADFLKKYN